MFEPYTHIPRVRKEVFSELYRIYILFGKFLYRGITPMLLNIIYKEEEDIQQTELEVIATLLHNPYTTILTARAIADRESLWIWQNRDYYDVNTREHGFEEVLRTFSYNRLPSDWFEPFILLLREYLLHYQIDPSILPYLETTFEKTLTGKIMYCWYYRSETGIGIPVVCTYDFNKFFEPPEITRPVKHNIDVNML